jgi:hypothetical protein
MRALMVGVIQKILLKMVEAEAGPEGLATLKAKSNVPPDRNFRIDTVYSDTECLRLFEVACEVLGKPLEELFELYADYFCKDALERWPTWFQMSSSSREFLERQPTIHNCFATGLRDPEARRAVVDKFRIERTSDGIITHYRSPNHLCGLYKALGRWVARHYGDTIEITEPQCMLHGAPECEIHVHWEEARA